LGANLGKIGSYLLIILFIFTAISFAEKKSNSNKFDYLPGTILVKFKSGFNSASLGKVNYNFPINLSQAEPIFPKYNSLGKSNPSVNISRLYKIAVDQNKDLELLCSQLENSDVVEYAEPNYLFPVEAVPNDSLWDKMWHLVQVQAPQAWEIAKGDSNVIIGIVDTGVDWNHPDLANSIWHNPDETIDGTDTDNNGFIDDVRGWDFIELATNYKAGEDGIVADNNPMDFDGHGTFVAGIAAASTNNSIGVSSLSWGCKIMPLRAGYNSISGGYIVLEEAVKAFIYATDNGADIINLSTSSSFALADAARYAWANGVVVTKSAGNERSTNPDPMELEPFVISVASVNVNDEKAGYSDYGRWVKVAAPGGEYYKGGGLTSTFFDDRYVDQQGTSYAAPNVAALAGLIKSANPDLSAAEIVFQVTETADNLNDINPGYTGLIGSGRINAYRPLTESAQPLPDLSFLSITVNDSETGNGNGRINDGENVNFEIQLKNNWGDANNLTATIETQNTPITAQKSFAQFDPLPGISDFENNIGDNSNDPFAASVDGNILPQMVPAVLQLSADNFSQNMQVSLPINPSLLLVDDDGGEEFEEYYIEALANLNCAYELWDVSKNGSPIDAIKKYDTVVWFCAHTGSDSPTLTEIDRNTISGFLDSGGQLFLSGMDIGWDLCEDDPAYTNTQYYQTGGTSKVFYENYLRCQYVSDDVGRSTVIGIPNDPIGAGIELQFDTPDNFDYPSEISALGDALPGVEYSSNSTAAIRYSNSYRLVYVAFGGIESIIDKDQRHRLFEKTLHWLHGIKIDHEPLKDTDKADVSVISVSVTTEHKNVATASLFWKVDTDSAYTIVELISEDEQNYFSEIPPQQNSEIEYGFVFKLDDGTVVPIQFHSFKVTIDSEPPEILSVSSPKSPFTKKDLDFETKISDDFNLTNSVVFLSYASSSGQSGEHEMSVQNNDSLFTTTLNESFFYGDTVFYSIIAMDGSTSKNTTETELDTFIVGLERFETGLGAWTVESGQWGQDWTEKHSGDNSLNDSPMSEIVVGIESIVSLTQPLDLAGATNATMSFWSLTSLRNIDTAFVEMRADTSANWYTLLTMTDNQPEWKKYNVAVNEFVGYNSVELRFRLLTDKEFTFESTGWYIDDLLMREQVSTSVPKKSVVPDVFYLAQNYPNPFNPVTQILFGMPKPANVQIEIYNNLGQLVKELVNRQVAAGEHRVMWNATDNTGNIVPAGIYYVKMSSENFIWVRKIAFVK
jgi:subtilisin family serine protease